MNNKFCNSENKKKVFYVVYDNYKGKKTIFIFLKKIINQNIYNYLKNFFENSDGEYSGKSNITENHKRILY